MLRQKWAHLLAPSWTIVLAIVAILDVWTCWPMLNDGWTEGRKQTKEIVNFEDLFKNHRETNHGNGNDDTCPVSEKDQVTCSTFSFPFVISTGLLFCWLCVLESILRARVARQTALENEALDKFEKKLANLYNATRCNVFRQQPGKDDYQDDVLARNTVRVWTPVASVLLGWFVLLPWTSFIHGYECGHDPSMASLWITQSLSVIHQISVVVRWKAIHFLWKLALPFSVFQPILLIQRLRLLARWLRYIRFAGPLVRLLLKLKDQISVFTKTWRQAWHVQTEKAKRVARRSMLFNDIQRIESLTRLQTTLISLPSQLFHMAQEQATDIGAIIAKKKEEGKRLKKRLETLKTDLRQSSKLIPSSEIYDRMVELTQELTDTVRMAFWNAHLISPHTRFSVGWRVIVTCALLSELFRLYTSWQLSGTFDLRYTHMTRRLLVECQQKGRPIRRWIGKLLHLPQADRILDTCRPFSASSRLCLHIARASEISIDVVCFLDIFVWFFTGELDSQGVIIPKHWFSRCILPGTLVQVFDHPTVPKKLPLLISYTYKAIRAVGYSRVLRWGLAIYPAVDMVVVAPLRSYLFRPMDDVEYLKYTESLGFIRTFSTASFYHPRHDGVLESYPSSAMLESSLRTRPSGILHSSIRSDWSRGSWH